MLDILIENGVVLGGDSDDRQQTNIGIAGERIVHIGPESMEAEATVDAGGCFVAPGFIDMHTHTDFTLPVRPQAEAKIRQGVTTDVTGNCGFSPFPLGTSTSELSHGAFLEPELTRRWPSLAAYAETLEASGLGINVVPLVGLGAVRLATVGPDDGAASSKDILAMQEAVRRCMRDGSFGASSGLVYAPSGFADQDELIAMASTVAEYGGIYATHMRNEGPYLLSSIESAIEIARRSGVSLQISHLKALGRKNWGSIPAALELIDAAVDEGIDVWFDVYPYTACSSTLGSLLPAYAVADGAEGLRRLVTQNGARDDLLRHLEAGEVIALEGVRVAVVPGSPELAGTRLTDLAEREGVAPAEACLALLEEHGTDAVMVADGMHEKDVSTAMQHPRAIAGSDGWTLAPESVGYAHPRNFGSTIRLLQTYALEQRLLSLDGTIELLSSRPARRLGLTDRGVVREGAIADLVIFDLGQLDEVSSLADPLHYPRGVSDVIVAGQFALARGELTGYRNGKVLLAGAG